jgi:hypothetical protein
VISPPLYSGGDQRPSTRLCDLRHTEVDLRSQKLRFPPPDLVYLDLARSPSTAKARLSGAEVFVNSLHTTRKVREPHISPENYQYGNCKRQILIRTGQPRNLKPAVRPRWPDANPKDGRCSALGAMGGYHRAHSFRGSRWPRGPGSPYSHHGPRRKACDWSGDPAKSRKAARCADRVISEASRLRSRFAPWRL